MSTVRFANTCDIPLPPGAGRLICNARSEEYGSWPLCRVCGAHVCSAHAVPGSLQEHDRDREGEDGIEAIHTEDVYCTACLAENGPEDTTTSTTKEPKQ